MNPTIKNWLFISLYYNQLNWGILINKGLIPFIKMMTQKNKMDIYVVHFGNHRGSYIGLSLRKKNDVELEDFASEADQFFKSHFINLPSSNYSVEISSFNIFANFPNNTIQYGLHHFPFYNNPNQNNKSVIRIHYKFSQIMLKALKDEVIDDDMLCTFSCYLHLIFLRNFHNSIHTLEDLLERVIKIHVSTENKSRESLTKVIEEYIPSDFDKNSLLDIIKDVLFKKNNVLSLEPNWTKDATKLFSSIIIKNMPLKIKTINNDLSDSMLLYSLIDDVIWKQLGLSKETEVILMHCLQEGIKTIIKERNREFNSLTI